MMKILKILENSQETFLSHQNSHGKRLGKFTKKPKKMRIRIQEFDDQNCKKFDK